MRARVRRRVVSSRLDGTGARSSRVQSSPVESSGVRWSSVHFAVGLPEVVAVVSAGGVRRARVRVQVGPNAARLATHVRHPDVRDGVVGEELGLVRGVRADLVRGFLRGPVEKNRRQ